MRWSLPAAIACLLLTAVFLPDWTPAQEKKDQPKDTVPQGPNFAAEIRPVVQKYCFECHSTQKKKAGLDLEAIAADASPANWPEVWDQVGERVRGREMPPAKSPQPSEDERQKLHDWVAHVAQVQVSCEKLTTEQLEKSTAGYTMSRRLNRTEYNNTVRDLFGVDIHPGDLLPSEGGGGEGFDNTGGTLFTTPAHMERYLEAAELVLETLFGPANAKEDPKAAKKVDPLQVQEARRKLLSASPGPTGDPREAATKILRPFMSRAFRRPVKDEELNRYVALFDKANKRGDSFEQALRLVLKGVMISPHFLFLVEPPPEKVGPYRLGHYEIASHLSYFLWASMPDDELLQLAVAGKLHDNEVLRGQVRRMIRDGRARGLAESFAVQWLGVGPLGPVVRPDSKLFPEFTDELAAAMREETVLFFDSIVREDRSVLDLINADYTFVNEPLAKLYKIDGVGWSRNAPRSAGRSAARRRAGTGEHPDRDIASAPHQPGAAGPMGLAGIAGCRRAAAAAQRARSSRKGQRRQTAAAPPAAGKTPLEGRVRRLPQPDGPAGFRPGKLRPAGPLADRAQWPTHRHCGRLADRREIRGSSGAQETAPGKAPAGVSAQSLPEDAGLRPGPRNQ